MRERLSLGVVSDFLFSDAPHSAADLLASCGAGNNSGGNALERHERVWDGALVDGREIENVGQYDTATVPAELHAHTVHGR